jgi:hypothetical protein
MDRMLKSEGDIGKIQKCLRQQAQQEALSLSPGPEFGVTNALDPLNTRSHSGSSLQSRGFLVSFAKEEGCLRCLPWFGSLRPLRSARSLLVGPSKPGLDGG